MAKPMFTPEELEELARADAELDAEFRQTPEEIRSSRKRDRDAQLDQMDHQKRKLAENQRAYYEANREKINAYWREYRRKKKEAQKCLNGSV